MLHIDHVILVADDYDLASARLFALHGLVAVAGGRHAGHGTGNRIVPLGPDYVELMAAIDPAEAAASPLGQWVIEHAGPLPVPAAVCLRTDDIDAVADRLGLEVIQMSRQRPDGATLAWRLCGLEDALGPQALPFFIQWDIDPADHPSRALADHEIEVDGIAWVEMGGDPEVLADRLGGADLPIRAVGGEPGVRRVAIATADGEIVL